MNDWIFDYGNHWHKGARKEQQDYFASSKSLDAVKTNRGFLALIADGMGGHTGGGSASVIAVKTFIEEYEKQGTSIPIPRALEIALEKANDAVVNANRKEGGDMGTTLVGCILQSNKLYWISVGDSALFLYQNGQMKRINEDHSYGAELDKKLEMGKINQHQANIEAKKRNMLTSYLGLGKIPKIDIQQIPIELKPGEKVLLCTDGLTNAMNESEIALYLKGGTAQEKCELLTQQALNKKKQRQDNITTVLLELKPKDIEQEMRIPDVKKKNTSQKLLIAGISLLILAALVTTCYYFKLPDKISSLFSGRDKKIEKKENILTQNTLESDEKKEATPDNTDSNKGEEEDDSKSEEITGADMKQEQSCEKTLKEIQDILKAMRLYDKEPTGIYDSDTEKAIKNFQFKSELTMTGKMDEETCRAMFQPCNVTWKDIQQLLQDMEVYQNSLDEIYTSKITDAIEKFQKTYRIRNTNGIIDKETCSMLKPCGATWRDIQQVLKDINIYNDTIDGKPGSKTKEAIKTFQEQYNLENKTGNLNNETCEKLKPALKSINEVGL